MNTKIPQPKQDLLRKQYSIKTSQKENRMNNNQERKQLLYGDRITPEQYTQNITYQDDNENYINIIEMMNTNISKLTKNAKYRKELSELILNKGDFTPQDFNDKFPLIYDKVMKNYAGYKDANQLYKIINVVCRDDTLEEYKPALSAETFLNATNAIIKALKSNGSNTTLIQKLDAINQTLKALNKKQRKLAFEKLQDRKIDKVVSETADKLNKGMTVSDNLDLPEGLLDSFLYDLMKGEDDEPEPTPAPASIPDEERSNEDIIRDEVILFIDELIDKLPDDTDPDFKDKMDAIKITLDNVSPQAQKDIIDDLRLDEAVLNIRDLVENNEPIPAEVIQLQPGELDRYVDDEPEPVPVKAPEPPKKKKAGRPPKNRKPDPEPEEPEPEPDKLTYKEYLEDRSKRDGFNSFLDWYAYNNNEVNKLHKASKNDGRKLALKQIYERDYKGK
jgi:hypothetical protein